MLDFSRGQVRRDELPDDFPFFVWFRIMDTLWKHIISLEKYT